MSYSDVLDLFGCFNTHKTYLENYLQKQNEADILYILKRILKEF